MGDLYFDPLPALSSSLAFLLLLIISLVVVSRLFR